MVSSIRIRVLVNSIIAVNWVLSKLTRALSHETIGVLSTIKDKIVIVNDPVCGLDQAMDNEINTRKCVSAWGIQQTVQGYDGD